MDRFKLVFSPKKLCGATFSCSCRCPVLMSTALLRQGHRMVEPRARRNGNNPIKLWWSNHLPAGKKTWQWKCLFPSISNNLQTVHLPFPMLCSCSVYTVILRQPQHLYNLLVGQAVKVCLGPGPTGHLLWKSTQPLLPHPRSVDLSSLPKTFLKMLTFRKNLIPCALWSGGWLYVLCFLIS